MIKLIATDMDGTLLSDKKELNIEIMDIIMKLKEKGITFIVASGRQYLGLSRMFEKVKDDIYFVAENGAFCVHKEKELFSSIMNRQLVKEVLDEIAQCEVEQVTLCSKYCAYTTDPIVVETLRNREHKYEIKLVDSLYHVDDEILKVSVMEVDRDCKVSFNRLRPAFKGRAEVTVSGFVYYDVVNKDVNKGNTIAKIQEQLGISIEETVAFGDNYNDLEMFERAGVSYAMENADDEIKQKADKVLGNNNDDVVIEEIKRLFHL